VANTLLTLGMITKETLRLFRNENAFLQTINTQYDDQFAKSGAKIGSTLKIRIPVDYVVRHGPTAVPQNTTETFTSLTVSNQDGIDFSFSSSDMALSIDEFSDRYLKVAVNALAGDVALNIMGMVEGGTGQGGVSNFVHAVDGSNNTITPTVSTILQAGAILSTNSAPSGRGKRFALLDPITQGRVVSGMSGFFNPQPVISDQTRSGFMGDNILGFDFSWDQTILKHQTAAFGTMPTVNGANQTGSILTVNTTTAPINAGDIFTIAGVFKVNRVNKQNLGVLEQFVATAAVPTGSTSIPIYPALTPGLTTPDAGNNLTVQYQTVVASPANGAALTMVNNASEVYRKNLCYVPEAFTLATADLPLPTGGVVEASRESYDGISMRMITYYNGSTDVWSTRLDILYGFALLRPDWCVALADSI
jgi:hypothetical protein